MKEQGTHTDEQLREMITTENFEKWKDVVRESVTKSLQMGMLVNAIAQKEGLKTSPLEVEDQFELVKAEAKGEPIDEAAVRDRIEAALERDLVLQWVAERSTVKSVPAPTAAAAVA